MFEDPNIRNRGPRRGAYLFFGYVALVIVAGWVVIGWSLTEMSWSDFPRMGSGFALMATFVLIAEMRPLLVAGSPDSNGVTITTCFVFAILIHWGWPVAILLQTVATVVGDRAQRRVWWRMAFNTGQYALSWAACAAVLALAGLHASPFSPVTLHMVDVWVIVAAGLTYFLVNDVLVSVAVALLSHQSLWKDLRQEFGFQLLSSGALLALAPFVVLALDASVWLVPLLLVPLLAVYKNGQVSLEQEHASLHDSLTGLPNRKYLLLQADEALDTARHEGAGLALCLLDLDRFKEVNDTLGHQVGDRLLQLVAARLRAAVRPTDTVARLGGDEFAVMFRDVDAAEAGRAHPAADRGVRRCVRRRRHVLRPRCQHRRRAAPAARGGLRGVAAPRRRRDVPRQARPQRFPGLRRGAGPALHRAAGAAGRAAPSHRRRPARPCTTSPRLSSPPVASSASRPWCGGTTPYAA